eukprot:6393774-Amphidinium_carterae.1
MHRVVPVLIISVRDILACDKENSPNMHNMLSTCVVLENVMNVLMLWVHQVLYCNGKSAANLSQPGWKHLTHEPTLTIKSMRGNRPFSFNHKGTDTIHGLEDVNDCM